MSTSERALKQYLVPVSRMINTKQSNEGIISDISAQLRQGNTTYLHLYTQIVSFSKLRPQESSFRNITRMVKNNLAWCCDELVKISKTLSLLATPTDGEFASSVNLDNLIDFLQKSTSSDNEGLDFSVLSKLQINLQYPNSSAVICDQINSLAYVITLVAFHSETGIGLNKNIDLAIKLQEHAIALGNTLAMVHRANMCVVDAHAIKLYEQAIALGNASAMSNLACLHVRGLGDLKDYARAIELFEQSIALGNIHAMGLRANMHEKGLGGLKDHARAIELYEQAIAMGSTQAMANRAAMHVKGLGGLKDYARAIELFEQALALGNNHAMELRGNMHLEGLGGLTDYARAIELFEQAIALGSTPAMVYRAYMYVKGLGGLKDDARAIELFEQAIARGSVLAMVGRGLMHENGEGGLVNLSLAARLYRRAAILGNAQGRAFLSLRNGPIQYHYQYHYLMFEAKIDSSDALLKLFGEHNNLLKEFYEFDCTNIDNMKKNHEFLLVSLNVLRNSRIEYLDFNKICALIIITIFNSEMKPSLALGNELRELKNYCLNQLAWGEVDQEYVEPLTHILVDLFWIDDEYREFVSNNLCKLIYRMSSFDNFNDITIPFKLIATILVKKIWGPEHEVAINSCIDLGQLRVLASFCDGNNKPDLSLAQALNVAFVEKKQLKRKIEEINPKYPTLEKRSNISGFFPGTISKQDPMQIESNAAPEATRP